MSDHTKANLSWRSEVQITASGELPIVYTTKITKTKVIPIYRDADCNGESQDIVCFLCDSFDAKTNVYTQKITYPYLSIVSASDSIKTTNSQITMDMQHNCNSLGIQVQDGIKEEKWEQFTPIVTNPAIIPIDDLSKYYRKDIEEITKINNPTGNELNEQPAHSEKVEEPKEEKKEKKEKVAKLDPSLSVSLNEPPYHLVSQPKGQKGRPRKVYDDPIFDALVRSIPHSVPCSGCGKEIIVVSLNIIDRARAMNIEVKELLSTYKCRSCK